MRTVRIFVSSPTDVSAERDAARRVIARLDREFGGGGAVDGFLWEQQVYDAGKTFTDQIPRAGTYDIVVVIVWARLGHPITVDGTDYQSGTEFEFIDAVRAQASRPLKLLVYRRTGVPPLDMSRPWDELSRAKQSYEAVSGFFDRQFAGFNGGIRGYNSYASPAEFEESLHDALRERVQEVLDSEGLQRAVRERYENPYRGLGLFNRADQHLFCGRTHALHQAFRLLHRQATSGRPFLAVVGPSGVGKSSFVRAALAPHVLDTEVLPGEVLCRTAIFEPSDSTEDLIGGFAAALCDEGALPELSDRLGSAQQVGALFRSNERAAVALLQSVLESVTTATGAKARLLLIIDPLEEVFTRRLKSGSGPGEDREAQVRALASVLKAVCASRLVWTLATLRIEFYEQSTAVQDLHELKQGEGTFHLQRLLPSELRQVVERPAAIAGLKFERDPERGNLEEVLVDQALTHSDPLPLLSYTLEQLFEQSKAAFTGEVTFAAYDQIGGVQGALTKRADEAFRAAAERMQRSPTDAWNKVFGLLVDVDADGRRVRTYARTAQFDDPDSIILKEELDRARLIVIDKDDRGEAVVSIAHEAMLRQWPALRAWMSDRAEVLRLRQSLSVEAREWDAGGRQSDLLLQHGARLARAEHYVQHPLGLLPGELIRAYVEANVRQRDAAEHARRARTRRLVIGLSAGFIAVSLLAVYAVFQTRVATQRGESAARHAAAGQEFTKFLLEEVKPALNLNEPDDEKIARQIVGRVTRYANEIDASADSAETQRQIADHLSGVANLVADFSQFRDAADIKAKSIELYLRAGEDRSEFLAQKHDEAGMYEWRGGEYQSAGEHFERAVAIVTGAGLESTQLHAKIMGHRARLFKTQGLYTRGAAEIRAAIRVLENAGSADPLELAGQYDALADLLRDIPGHDKECETLSQKAIQIARSEPKGRRPLASFLSEYGMLLLRLRRYPEAEVVLSEALATAKETAQQAEEAQINNKLARVLMAVGRYEEAAQCLQASYDYYQKNDPRHLRFAKCLEARADLYLLRGEPQRALEDAKRVVEIREHSLADINPDKFNAYDLLGRAARACGNDAEANHHLGTAAAWRSRFEESERTAAKELQHGH